MNLKYGAKLHLLWSFLSWSTENKKEYEYPLKKSGVFKDTI